MAKQSFLKYTALTLFSLSATVLSASPNIAKAGASNQVMTEQRDNTLSMIGQQNVQGTWGGKNPSRLTCNGFFLTADFLWWNAYEDGLDYATHNTLTTSGTSNYFSGKTLDVHSNWRPGCRVGLGWLFGHSDQWELSLTWTYFNGHGHRSHSSSDISTNQFVPSWSAFLGPLATSASAKWNVKMNTLDLELARSYFISKNIAVKPHMGLRGAWIDQNYHASYAGVWTTFNTSSTAVARLTGNTKFKASQDFSAIGIRTGFDVFWNFNKHWGIFGQVSGSLLYSDFDVKEKIEGFRAVSSTALGIQEVKEKADYNRVRANLETALGLQWETSFCKDKCHFSVGAAYELSQWFQQNQLFSYATGVDSTPLTSPIVSANTDLTKVVSNGDLSFQGLTVKFAFNF